MNKRDYDSTLARMAGNIAAGLAGRRHPSLSNANIVRLSVDIANDIIAEIKRTESTPEAQ